MKKKILLALVASSMLVTWVAQSQDSGPAMSLMLKGQTLNQQGRHGEAVPVLQRAVRLSPSEIFGRNQLGLALIKTNKPEEALLQFIQVLELDPKNFFARAWIKEIM